MNTQPAPVGRILQLLLRCGMVCQEELDVVLEMMPAMPEPGSMSTRPRVGSSTEESSSIDISRDRG